MSRDEPSSPAHSPWKTDPFVVFAEAVSLDGGALVAVLVILFLVAAVAVAVAVLGFVWAARAARGSTRALQGWAAVLVLEVFVLVTSGFDLRNGALWTSLALVIGQVITFAGMRRRG